MKKYELAKLLDTYAKSVNRLKVLVPIYEEYTERVQKLENEMNQLKVEMMHTFNEISAALEGSES